MVPLRRAFKAFCASSVSDYLLRAFVVVGAAMSYTYFIIRESPNNKLLSPSSSSSFEVLQSTKKIKPSSIAGLNKRKKKKKKKKEESYLHQGLIGARRQSRSHFRPDCRCASRLPNIGKPLRIFYIISTAINLVLAVKYSILCVLDLEALREYRFLTCYLLGRYNIEGRVISFSKYIALFLLIFHASWRLVMVVLRPNFNLDCMEFLLYNYDELLTLEMQQQQSRMKLSPTTPPCSNGNRSQRALSQSPLPLSPPHLNSLGGRLSSLNGCNFLDCATDGYQDGALYHDALLSSSPLPTQQITPQAEHKPLLEYENTFSNFAVSNYNRTNNAPATDHLWCWSPPPLVNCQHKQHLSSHYQLDRHRKRQFKLRPNRTAKAWSDLKAVVMGHLLFYFCIAICSVHVFSRLIGSIWLTKLGFQLNYLPCLEWISEQPNKQDYLFIFDVSRLNLTLLRADISPRMLTGQLFSPLNGYHILRLIVEFIENSLVYFESLFGFTFDSILAILISADIRCYTTSVHYKLRACVRLLHASDHCRSTNHSKQFVAAQQPDRCTDAEYNHHHNQNKQARRDQRYQLEPLSKKELDDEIEDTQLLILDLFAKIGAYNSYASFFTAYSVLLWLVFSFLICTQILVPGSVSPTIKFDWYFAQMIVTLHMVIGLGSFARVKVATESLYPLIATIGAIDHEFHRRKKRWQMILKHYGPIALHCFTTFSTVKISWLVLVKLVAWILSFVFVASSFINNYDHLNPVHPHHQSSGGL